jgi:hypothetical protein
MSESTGRSARGAVRRRAGHATAAAVLAALLGACGGGAGERAASESAAAQPGGADGAGAAAATAGSGDGATVALFDGHGLDRWRGYKRQDAPAAWQARGDTLVFVPVANKGDRGDLLSRDQFGDFELEYEWRVVPGANSGVMWRVSEDNDFPWQSGAEQQVLDDERHPDGKIPTHRAGALYDLVVPPAGVARAVGEFNQARIVARGPRVQLFLNGKQTADVDFASDSGRALVARSKFKDLPNFARNARGHIVLQDHADTVYFRNVRIRALDGGTR